MGELVSRAFAAKKLGISRQALEKLIKAGMVSQQLNPNGKRPKYVLDLEVAQVEYAKNTDPAKRKDGGKRPAASKPRKHVAQKPKPTAQPAPSKPEEENITSDQRDDDEPDYYLARARKTEAEASAKELALQEKKGELIDREAAEQATREVAMKIRDRLRAFPSRLAAYVPNDVMPEIEDEIYALLRELEADARGLVV